MSLALCNIHDGCFHALITLLLSGYLCVWSWLLYFTCVYVTAGRTWSSHRTCCYCRCLQQQPLMWLCHSTHYRSFQVRFYRPHDQPTVSKHWRKPFGHRDQAWISPEPLHHVSIIQLGNRLYAQSKGPSVTNQIWWTCKNCSYRCAADCEHCVTQSCTQQFW